MAARREFSSGRVGKWYLRVTRRAATLMVVSTGSTRRGHLQAAVEEIHRQAVMWPPSSRIYITPPATTGGSDTPSDSWVNGVAVPVATSMDDT